MLLEHVPAPKVSATYMQPGTVLVEWVLTKLPHPPIEIDHYRVSLIGTEFANNLKSDARLYELVIFVVANLNFVLLLVMIVLWKLTVQGFLRFNIVGM